LFVVSSMKKYLYVITIVLLVSPVTGQDSIKIYFTGDVTLSNHFENHAGHNYGYAFERMSWFADADISMVNLENPLTRRGEPQEKLFTFRAPPEYCEVLKAGGIDIVTLANNHMYDFGDTGLLDTIEYLHQAGILYVGAGRNMDEARAPVVMEIKGIRVAFLGYYGTGRHSNSRPATADSAGTAMRYLPYIEEDVAAIRDKVDYIIINFHWGLEKANYPTAEEQYFARRVIDAGADVIIGHHPHVLQGIEKYKDRIIAYSLGNFIFGGNSRTHEKSAILELRLSKNKMEAELIPISIDFWQPARLNGEAAKAVIDSVKKYSTIFEETIF